LRIGEVEGRVIEITQLSIVLDTAEGRAVIPAKQFNELTTLHRAGVTEETGEQS
jgi:RNase P/RNase MRP subunit p29